jgi:hypothetical protein
MPLGWVAAAGIGGSIITGSMQAGAAEDAANAQANSAANAQQISQNEFNTITAQNQPFMQSGYGALSALDWGLGISPQTASGGAPTATQPSTTGPTGSLSGAISGAINNPQGGFLNAGRSPTGVPYQGNTPIGGPVTNGPSLGGSGVPIAGTPASGGQGTGLGFGSLTKQFDTSDWQQLSPAYNFNVQQGRQGVLNSDAAGAGALSGAAQKDLINYNQAAANNSFNNAFNQYQTQQGNIFSRLSGIAQLGQSSANNTGQQGTALAGQAAQSATNIGTAQAGGIVGSANAISGGINNAIPWLTATGGSNPNNSASNWDTENPNNFQDFASSDRRLKTDIERIGATDSGIPLYRFRYLNSDRIQVGVMADEVVPHIPEAVINDHRGYQMVNYRMLR